MKFNKIIVYVCLVFYFNLYASLASQSQSQSPGGMQQQSPNSDGDEKEYKVWKNGGGKVHKNAIVDASVFIDADSRVGSDVIVEKGAKISKSLLMGLDAEHKAHVGKFAKIEGSTLQGEFNIGESTQINGSTIQGPFDFKASIKIRGCSLSALSGALTKINSDMSDQMAMYPKMN